jgi:hypothetical protein
VEKGIKKLELLSPVGCELNFQPITEGHQIIDLRSDAALFRQWWEAYDEIKQNRLIQILHG